MQTRFEHGYALLIGVGRTVHAPWSLPVTVHDVKAIKDILTDPAHCAYPDNPDHIRLICDGEATGPAILAGLSWLKARAEDDAEATALVYYAGHGFLEKETGLYYLIPHEADPSNIAGTSIPARDFTQAIQNIPARRLLIVLDCCHAEAMATASRDLVRVEPPPGFVAATPENLLNQGEGRAVYSASRGNQRAWDRADRTQGIFTYHFLEALKGAGTLPGLPEVRLSHLMSHLGHAVPRTAKQQWGIDQTPFFNMAAEDFPVALAMGGKAVRSVPLTVDPARVFDGDYKNLREAYISPWPVFERVKIDCFTGRTWLEERLDAFLRNPRHDRGVFVLEAEAGLGKTAFLAHLVQGRRYIHHFSELARGQDGIAAGLRSLAAQLIRSWELNPYLIDGMLPGSAGRPDFLQNLLKEAADRRDQVQPGEPIVLVVDALDEAGTPAGQNVLGLPRVLPRGVFLIVSHRPVDVALSVEGPRHVEPLRADDTKNLADMREFLEAAVTWPGVRKALESDQGRIPDSRFIETLLEKSRGVWIYLHYVVAEIERGQRLPLKLDELPKDLWQYYADYWRRWRDSHGQSWDSMDLPLLTTLAAAQEALPPESLLSLAGIDPGPETSRRARRVLDGEWSPYLTTPAAASGTIRAYRFYHASLREFFAGAIDPGNLTRAERSLAEDLAAATQEAQARICKVLTNRWGGWDAGLPALRTLDPARLGPLDRYGLQFLAAHLEAAGRADDLHRLLRLEWAIGTGPPGVERIENAWFTVHDRTDDLDGYMSDVARAWRLADRDMEAEPSARPLGRQLRSALISASIGSLAANLPASLLVEVVKAKLWPPARALAFARRISNPQQLGRTLAGLASHLEGRLLAEALATARAIGDEQARAEALSGLGPHLGPGLLAEALAAARAIGDEGSRARALIGLGPHLGPGLLVEALAAARALGHEQYRAEALSGLGPHLGPELLAEALAAARALGHEWDRAEALRGLAPHLGPELLAEALAAARAFGDEGPRAIALSGLGPHLGPELLAEALAAARALGDEWSRARALSGLAPHLGEPERARVLAEALAAARAIGDEGARARALRGLVPHLGEPERARVLAEALAAARAIGDERIRVMALIGLGPHLGPELLAEALAAARAIEDEGDRGMALRGLAPHLGPELLAEALAAARAIWQKGDRGMALSGGMAPHLGEPQRARVLAEALAAARAIGDERFRVMALIGLGPHLGPELLAEALAAARAIGDEGDRAEALSGLGPHLGPELLAEALAAARAIGHEWARARALSGLGPHLGPELLAEALAAAAIGFEWDRARALSGLGPHLGPELLAEALAAARAIGHEQYRAEALSGLAPHLGEPQRARVLAEALAAARAIGDERFRPGALSGLAPHLGPELLAEALAAARAIGDEGDRARALSGLGPHLGPELLAEALAAARAIGHEQYRARALSGLAPHLGEPQRARVLAEALAAARALGDEGDRAEALSGLGPHLGPELLAEALAAARALGHEWDRAEALRGLAPHLGPELLAEALAAARTIGYEGSRAEALRGLAPHLGPELLAEALAAARAIGDGGSRAKALSDLAPFLVSLPSSSLAKHWSEALHQLSARERKEFLGDLKALSPVVLALGGRQAAEELASAIGDVGRWWP